jgi:uncharacterized RDD family membrane protein YckC
VLRCLAKDPTDRLQSYGALTEALRPFDSTAPTPASLGLRFLAGVIDLVILNSMTMAIVLFTGLQMLPESGHPLAMFPAFMVAFLLQVFYYGVLEGHWGASIGKALCGLRVVTREGKPGFTKAMLRSFVFTLLLSGPSTVLTLVVTPQVFVSRGSMFGIPTLMTAIAIIFSTARRTNGFAALHVSPVRHE